MPTFVRIRWYAGAGDGISHAVSDAAVPDVSGYIHTLCGMPSAHIGAEPPAQCEECEEALERLRT